MSRNGRGFEDEARQRVIDAARRSGLSVGDLVQALSETPRRPTTREPVSSGDRDLERRLDALSDRMRRLGGEPPVRRAEAPVRRDRDAAPDPALEEIAATVDRLAGGGVVRGTGAPPAARGDETARILDMLEGLDRRVRSLGEERAAPRAAAPAPRATATPPVPQPAPAPTPAPTPEPTRAEAPRARRASLLEEPRSPRRTPVATGESDPLDRRFRELGDKIDALRQSEDRDGSAALIAEIRALRTLVETRAGAGTDVTAEIKRLAGRIDRLAEQRPQREVIESVATELGRLRDVVLQSNVEGSLRSIEEGYGLIVDRLDDLKRGLADRRGSGRIDEEITEIRSLLTAVPRVDQLSALERSLDTLADKFERMAARQETPAAQQIERRLADLRQQIDALDPSRLVVSLDQRLQAVNDKLDAVERSTRAPVASDRVIELLEELRTIAAGNRTAEQMTALEQRIEELGRRIADFELRRPSFEDTDRLHERIAEIAGRLDDIAAGETERASGAALEAAVARLDAAIAEASSPRAEQLIDARFDELIDRIDRRMPNDPTAEVEALTREITEMRRELATRRPSDDLEAQMRLLAERLDHSVADAGDDEALVQIEEQLSQISRRLEESQDRFADFASLEDHILRLADRMESGRVDAVAAAREAAREMVRELATRPDDGATEAAMRALQDDLRSLQSAARDSETRNFDTLASLHDALTGIVGRLAAIEKIAQGSARSAAAARSAALAAETIAQAATQQAIVQPAEPARSVEAPVPAAAPTPEAAIRPTVAGRPVALDPVARARQMLAAATPEDNRPLEPGSGKPQARPVAPPVAAAPTGEPVPTPAAARKADFIAAARRAAQAAVATTAPAVTPEDRPTPQAAPEAPADGEGGGALSRIGKVLKGRRRPLVLATAALVLAILTLQVIPGRKSEKVETASVAIERTAPTPTTVVAPSTERKSDERAPATDAEMLSKTPTGVPSVGFSMPRTGDAKPASTAAIAPTTPTAPAASTEATAPEATPPTPATPVAEPATTGSVPPATAVEPAPRPATQGLPEAIGPAALRTAAASGDPKAAFEIGLRLAEGRTVPADLAAAASWYEKAATAGLPQAQYRLGIALEKGLGVARDPEKAKSWYLAAAEKGNVRAMHNLGVLHANARDMANAIPWFQKAADLGLRDSQFNLGIIYALGSGVKQDLAVSYKWFALAARQGDQEAEKKQNDVAAHLDKVNLAAARMAVQTWVQRRVDHATNDEMRDWGDAPATAAAAPSPADLVRGAQQMLKAKGFYAGIVDGETGPATRAAIRAFQKKSGLAQTGEVDANLLRALAGRAL